MHFTGLRKSTATAVVAAWTLLGFSALGAAQTTEPPQPPSAPSKAAPEAAEPTAPAEVTADEASAAEATASETEATASEADAEAAPEEARTSKDSGILVTGTRIKRTDSFSLPASVAVADRKELAQTGANNMADVVRNMSINYGSDLNTDVSTNSGGSSQFNLRGLGLSSTLVLLNGRRLVLSGALSVDGSNFVDTSTLPLQAVERIEVLKGGASSIYGSDAVAGVVNIITRKRMNGFEAQAGYQSTGKFDQHEWDASLVGGAQGETTRVMGMAAYMKREPLLAGDRAYTNYTDLPYLPSANSSLSAYPSVFIPLPSGSAPSFRDPGCGTAAGPLTEALDPSPGVHQCRFNFNNYFDLVPDEQRFNSFLSVEQDISAHAMAFVEAGYARNRTSRILSPSLALLNPVVVPANSEWNPTGSMAAWQGRIRGGAYPPWGQNFNSDTLHTVAGVKGDLGGIVKDSRLSDWTWELAGTWSATRYVQSADDTVNSTLQTSLNSCDPSNATFNPANCWNPFSFGPRNSTELYQRINTQPRFQQDNELTTLTLDFSGPLMALPAGDLSLAFGSQVRRDASVFDADHALNTGDIEFASKAPDWTAERRIWAGYAELAAPLAEGFELQAAGRMEHFSDVGSSGLNPMLGVTWTPATTFTGRDAAQISKVRLHGTVATSFVAPSLLQAQGVQNVSTNLKDVVLDSATGMPTLDTAGRPTLSNGANYVTVRVLGNRDLKPQTSTAFTGGIAWPVAKGVDLALDYWHYKYKQIIIAPDPQNFIRQHYNDPKITRLNGVIQSVETQFENATSATTHGVDLDVLLRRDLGAAGMLSVTGSATYVFSYDIPIQYFTRPGSPDAKCNATTCDVAGLRNRTNFARAIPRFRFNLPVSWAFGGHAVSATGHFIGSYKDEQYVAPAALGGSENAPFYGISSWFTLDLQYSFRLKESPTSATTVRLGVTNLFDANPPFVRGAGFNFDTETHDPRGRLLYARLIQEL